MIDTTLAQAFLIGFFVLAALATAFAAVAVAAFVIESRRQPRPVVALHAAHPAAVAVTRRAA